MTEWAGVGAVVSAVAAVAALVVALRANDRADEANRLAVEANARADEANRIAQDVRDIEQQRDMAASRPTLTLRIIRGTPPELHVGLTHNGTARLDEVSLRVDEERSIGFSVDALDVLREYHRTSPPGPLGASEMRPMVMVWESPDADPVVIIASVRAGRDAWAQRLELAPPATPNIW